MRIDEVGYWTEIKLDILREYAGPYSRILRSKGFTYLYIDAFAGAGEHISKTTGELIAGSPTIALGIEPPFYEYHFIDLDRTKATALEERFGDRPNVFIYAEDCNNILLHEIIPKVRYDDYRRALCLLDPYGLHLDWKVILAAGKSRTIEIFLNFPVMDMNMNVLWHDTTGVRPDQVERMNSFWGDESWRECAYTAEPTLFGDEEKKADIEIVAEAFRNRLEDLAGFQYVPQPLPMRNSRNVIVYYLFFAAHQPVARSIVTDIFNKYRDRQV